MRKNTKTSLSILLGAIALTVSIATSGSLRKKAGLDLSEVSKNEASLSSFNFPTGVAVDGSGNLYITEWENHVIRKMSPHGEISTFAGSGVAGFVDGSGTESSFNQPTRIAIDKQDNLYVIDQLNHSIRKITPNGEVSTLAGSGMPGSVDDSGDRASFFFPQGIGIGPKGNIFVADFYNNKIRKITPSGLVSTFAGTGALGYTDGLGSTADFAHPRGLVVDKTGNLYVTEWTNNVIRKITPEGTVSTFAGSGRAGNTDGENTTASFNGLSGIVLDNEGNVYVSEEINQGIRKISSRGFVTTIAGNGLKEVSGGNGINASFHTPLDMAFDEAGNLVVADYGSNEIHVIPTKKLTLSKIAMIQ